MLKRALLTVLILVAGHQAVQAENLKIGAILDLSGDYADVGHAFQEGLTLAVEEVNRAGGVRGQLLELVVEDSHYNMAQTQSAARKLINVDKIIAAVIATYTEVKVAGPTFEAARIPIINLWDSAPQIESLGNYVFGIGAWTPSAGEQAAVFSAENLKARTAVIINTNGEWSLDVSKVFRDQFELMGGQVLEEISLNPSDTDFKTAILRARQKDPDVLYAPVADNIVPFFKQLSMMKFGAPVITSDVITENSIENLKEAAEGIYQTQTATPDAPATRHMLELYRKHYHRECKTILLTAWAYDAIGLIHKAAMSSPSPSGELIKAGLYQIKDFPGASGSLTISPQGSSKAYESTFQIQGGKLHLQRQGASISKSML